jgi:hypothetical protein
MFFEQYRDIHDTRRQVHAELRFLRSGVFSAAAS